MTLKGLVPDSEETMDITLTGGVPSIRMTDEDADAYRVEALEQSVFSIIINAMALGRRVKAPTPDGSAMEQAYAIFVNVLELNENAQVLNARYACTSRLRDGSLWQPRSSAYLASARWSRLCHFES